MRRSPSIPGRFRAVLATATALVALALAGPAAAAVVPTFASVTQEGGIAADCTAPLPGGAGAGSATYSHSAGIGTIQTNWSIPAQITPGAQVTLSLQMNTTQGFSGLILLNAPSEFGGATAPFEVAGSTPSSGGSFSGSKTITFTPTRAFTPGEEFVLRLGNGCNAFLYRYVATGTPDTGPATPATPRLSPRTTRPVPGVVTSYAAPRPGKVAALPFPATGCAPPATTNALDAQTVPAGGECTVDIFVRRTGGQSVEDAEAVFGVDTRITSANLNTAFRVCFAQAVDVGVALNKSNEVFNDADQRFRRCVLIVARILERADDLKKARLRKPPAEHVSHAAHSCRSSLVRLRGQARRTSPVTVACRHTRAGTRLTLRSARRGVAVGDLVSPTSTLLVGRSDATRYRAGDRIDVLWRVIPPPTTTTIRTPAPLAP